MDGQGGDEVRAVDGHGGRRRSSRLVGWLAAAVVVFVAVALVLVAVLRPTGKTTSGQAGGAPTTSTVPSSAFIAAEQAVTHVPASALDSAGIDGQTAEPTPAANPIDPGKGSSAALPAVGGKPSVFFFGAEWCPYCEAERLSLIVALSRFGTITGLTPVTSSSTDVYPDTQTFGLDHSTYSSPYINFQEVEIEDQNKNPLQQPTASEARVLQTWDPQLSFPFLDIAGRYIGGLPAWISPGTMAGLSRTQIAADLSQPGSGIGAQLDANANYLSAAICAADGGRPGSVCDSPGVKAAAAQLSRLPGALPF